MTEGVPPTDASSSKDEESAPPIVLLIALNALSFISVNIFLPSLPQLVDEFHTDVPTVLSALTIYLAGIGVGQLAYGPASDRYGRRRALLVGITIFAIGSVACAASTDILTFLSGRLLQALGGAAGATVSRAIIRDSRGADRSASVIGYMVMGTTVATGIAPVLGGFLDVHFGWRSIFILLAALAVVLGIYVARLRETQAPNGPPLGLESLKGYHGLLQRRAFLRHALYASFLFGCWYAFVSGAPIALVRVWGMPRESFAIWWTVGSVSYIFGNYLAGRLSDRLGRARMIARGSLLLLAGSGILLALAIADVRHPLAVFLPMGLLLIGFGIAQPNAMAAAISVDPLRTGAASGLLGSMQIAVGMTSITLVGALPEQGTLSFASVCFGMVMLAVTTYLVCKEKAGAH